MSRGSLLLVVGLASLGAWVWMTRDARGRQARRAARVRSELTRWEGEGGQPVAPATSAAAGGGPATPPAGSASLH